MTDAHVLRAIVEKTGMQNVLWAEVVLQAEKIISGPFGGRVGASGQLSDQGKGVLQGDRIGKPKASALDGTGQSETRIPVSQAHAVLNIDARHWIGCAEAPFVVTVRRFQA